jgi:hypothetical protein
MERAIESRSGRRAGTLVVFAALLIAVLLDARAEACGFPAGALPPGSYRASCENCQMNGVDLVCDCRNIGGGLDRTSIDVTNCETDPANTDGQLVCSLCAPVGSCCLGGVNCQERAPLTCQALGGSPGQGSQCLPDACEPEPGECDGSVVTWVGGRSGSFGDPENWEPPQVPTYEEGGTCDAAVFDSPRVTVDFAPTLGAASRASALPRGPNRTEPGRVWVRRGHVQAHNSLLTLRDASTAGLRDASMILSPEATLILHAGADVIAETVRLDSGSELELSDVFQVNCTDMLVTEGLVELRGGLLSCGSIDARTGKLDLEGASSAAAATDLVVSELRVADDAQIDTETAQLVLGPSESTVGGETGTEATWRVSTLLNIQEGGRLLVGATGLLEAALVVLGSGGSLVVGAGQLDVSAVVLVNEGGTLRTNHAVASIGTLSVDGGSVEFLHDTVEPGPSIMTDGVGVHDGSLSLEEGVHVETAGSARVDPPTASDIVAVDVGAAGDDGDEKWTVLETLSLGTGGGLAFLALSNSLVEAGHIEIGELGIVHGIGTFFVRNTPPFTGDGFVVNRGSLGSDILIDGSLVNAGEMVELLLGEGGLPQLNPLARQLPRIVRRGLAGPAALGGPLVVTGDATLGGTLVLQFRNGYAPAQGQPLAVLDVGGSVTGEFENVEVQGLAPGALFDGALSGGVYTVVATNTPEPLPPLALKAKKKLNEAKKGGSKVKIGRTGDRSQALLVHYRMGGSARNGVDYQLLEGTLEIPAGKKSATLRIVPIADGFAEPPETIELELLPGDGYSLPLAAEVAIELVDAKPKKGGG